MARIIPEHFNSDGGPKRPFETEVAAHQFLIDEGWELRYEVYPCSFCKGFHLATLRRRLRAQSADYYLFHGRAPRTRPRKSQGNPQEELTLWREEKHRRARRSRNQAKRERKRQKLTARAKRLGQGG